jgi:hypothetical protein
VVTRITMSYQKNNNNYDKNNDDKKDKKQKIKIRYERKELLTVSIVKFLLLRRYL